MARDLVQEEPHAGEAEGHGVLVAGGHERGGAVGRVGLQQFEGAAEMADVGMGIDESGRDPPAPGVDDPGLVAAGMIGAGPHVTDPPLAPGHLHAVQQLAGVDVDQAPAGDQQVGLDLAHAGAYQALDRVSGLPHRSCLTLPCTRPILAPSFPVFSPSIPEPHSVIPEPHSVIPAKAGIQGWPRGAAACSPGPTPPSFPLSREYLCWKSRV